MACTKESTPKLASLNILQPRAHHQVRAIVLLSASGLLYVSAVHKCNMRHVSLGTHSHRHRHTHKRFSFSNAHNPCISMRSHKAVVASGDITADTTSARRLRQCQTRYVCRYSESLPVLAKELSTLATCSLSTCSPPSARRCLFQDKEVPIVHV